MRFLTFISILTAVLKKEAANMKMFAHRILALTVLKRVAQFNRSFRFNKLLPIHQHHIEHSAIRFNERQSFLVANAFASEFGQTFGSFG